MDPFLRKPATAVLLGAITLVFGVEVVTASTGNPRRLVALGAITDSVFKDSDHWRLLAAMFLHADVMHWMTNAWALSQLGGLFEEMFGWRRFLVVWFTTGLCASCVSAMSLETGGTSVGASGAIFGITGAFLFAIRRSSRWRDHPVSRGLRIQLALLAVVNIVLGLMTPIIDNAAHIGGFASGLLVGLMPRRE